MAGATSRAASRPRTRSRVGTGLLLHAERPVGPTGLRHSTAWTTDLPRFVALLAVGRGRSVLAAFSLNEQVALQVARVWPDRTRAGFYDHLDQRRGRSGLERFCPICLDVPTGLLEFYEARVGQGACYLLHFDQPVGRKAVRHYVGFSTDVPRRFLQHRRGERAACRPARIAARLGIGVRLGRTWFPGSLELERQLQQADGVEALCRICQAEGTEIADSPTRPVRLRRPSTGSGTAEPAWSGEDDQELLTGFAASMRVADLSERLERPKAAVRRRLGDRGKLTRWSARQDAELRQAAAEGVGVEALAERFGRSPADVQARLDRHAEIDANRRQYPRVGSKWTDELDRELVRRFDLDQPISEIAQALGRSTGGIRARLEKLGKLDRSTGL